MRRARTTVSLAEPGRGVVLGEENRGRLTALADGQIQLQEAWLAVERMGDGVVVQEPPTEARRRYSSWRAQAR